MGTHVSHALDTATQHHRYPGDSLHIVAPREIGSGGLLGAPDAMHDLTYTLLRIVQLSEYHIGSKGIGDTTIVHMGAQ